MIHMALSITYGFVLAWAVSRWGLGRRIAAVVGGVFGLVLYLINFYGFTALFPWFAEARGWISISSHSVFGVVLGGAYAVLHARNLKIVA